MDQALNVCLLQWLPTDAQDLVARGAVSAGKLGYVKGDEEGGVCREVTINAAAPAIRNHLTKRSTQDDMARRTGTMIVVRGRYMPPGVPQTGDDKPLCLRVTPGLSKAEVGACCLSPQHTL